MQQYCFCTYLFSSTPVSPSFLAARQPLAVSPKRSHPIGGRARGYSCSLRVGAPLISKVKPASCTRFDEDLGRCAHFVVELFEQLRFDAEVSVVISIFLWICVYVLFWIFCCAMLDSMPVTIMAKNYSHCPLKKRPVPLLDSCSGVYYELVYRLENLERTLPAHNFCYRL